MKVKYMAALAAASVFGMASLTSCGPTATEDAEAPAEVAPDAAADPGAATDGDASTDAAADPCAADPCAAK